MDMQYTYLGRTGVKVSRLCLGCMGYGDPKWRPWALDEQAAMPFFRKAVEGDGRDEIILGSAVLDDNGTAIWSTGLGHPDSMYVGQIDPSLRGLQIYYNIETRNPRDGMCLVDARTGKLLWGHDQGDSPFATLDVFNFWLSKDGKDGTYAQRILRTKDLPKAGRYADYWLDCDHGPTGKVEYRAWRPGGKTSQGIFSEVPDEPISSSRINSERRLPGGWSRNPSRISWLPNSDCVLPVLSSVTR